MDFLSKIIELLNKEKEKDSYLNDTFYRWINTKHLSDEFGIPVKKVRYHCDKLVKRGLLVSHCQPGGWKLYSPPVWEGYEVRGNYFKKL